MRWLDQGAARLRVQPASPGARNGGLRRRGSRRGPGQAWCHGRRGAVRRQPGYELGPTGVRGARRFPDRFQRCVHSPAKLAQALAGLLAWADGGEGRKRMEAMTVRVGVNGFGRIGRNFLRAVLAAGADLEIIAVNDLTRPRPSPTSCVTTRPRGAFGPVDVEGADLLVGERHIRVMAEREPEQLPWGELGVDVVIESTGSFTSRAAAAGHLGGRSSGSSSRRRRATPTPPSSSASTTRSSTPSRTSWSPTPRARRTASSRWSRCSTTRSASSAGS